MRRWLLLPHGGQTSSATLLLGLGSVQRCDARRPTYPGMSQHVQSFFRGPGAQLLRVAIIAVATTSR